MPRRVLLTAVLVAAIAIAACGGDDDGDGEDEGGGDVNPSVATATAIASQAEATEEPDQPNTPRAASTLPPRTPGAPLDEAQAAAILDYVLLKPEDITESGWIVQSDTSADNAVAAEANPDQAASIERCGRLLARTITNFPPDVITAFIGGTTLAFFSTATLYETPEGATDCAAESAQRLSQPGELARTFGTVFVDPLAVVVTPVDFPTPVEGAGAATLTGKSNASGQEIDLTILVVFFRIGNTTAAVGSAQSGSTPSTEELAPYVELVAERIEESQ
jgi:hypothetical protein